MGRSAGTGSPVWFRCWRDRRGYYHDKDSRIELTGRVKPHHNRGRSRPMGSRSDFVQREYRCTCGFVGWSNHMDLAKMAGDEFRPR